MHNFTNISSEVKIDIDARILLAVQIILCVISIIAFVEHFAILSIVLVNKTLRKKPFVVSILMLSCSDLLSSLSMLLISLIGMASLRQTWICGLTYFLLQVGMVTSLVNTLTICIERYRSTKPTPSQAFSLRKREIITFGSMGICSVLFGIPYLFTVKKEKLESCTVRSLFEENMPFATAPVRSITFMIWICTIVLYGITAKNFKNILKRTDALKRRHPKTKDMIRNDTATSSKTSNLELAGRMSPANDMLNDRHNKPITNTMINVLEVNTCRSNPSVSVNSSEEMNSNMRLDERHAHGNPRVQCVVKPGISTQTLGTVEKEIIPVRRSIHKIFPDKATHLSVGATAFQLGIRGNPNSPAQPRATEAFRIVSVIFLVFVLSMTGQSVVGFLMIFLPLSDAVMFGCGIMASSTVLTNPIMYAFLLKDFRKVLRCR